MAAARLADDERCLAELTVGDLDVGRSIAASFDGHRAALPAISRLPEVSPAGIASCLGCPVAAAEALADRLVDARLLDELDTGGYRMRRLTRLAVTTHW